MSRSRSIRAAEAACAPSDEVTFLPLFILVLPGSSFHHRARTRRALRASQKSTGENCWLLACRKLAQIGYSIYCTRLYLSALFLRVLSSSTSLLRPHTNGSSQAPCALITANENTCARSLLNLARLHSTPDNKLVAAGGQISIPS